MKKLLIAAALSLTAAAAHAQSVTFGAGYADFSDDQSKDAARIALEYHFAPFHQGAISSFALGTMASVDSEKDYFIGFGVVGTWTLKNDWFIEASVMPGYYNEYDPLNRIGGKFHFRSLFGVGRTLASGDKVSVGLTHMSNASTETPNPGVNALMLRYTFGF
ncbi:acyloxyacyl hydrolase [Albibacillus kandeliae]|uniref:acyloxyacyl hydrolase n=1 Tax=Albibacillus kandeliae TaxID=2174228 RepID=UPI000D685FAB|nr:acyloxyacyl hydrolase [Albibacillus kandeliae]